MISNLRNGQVTVSILDDDIIEATTNVTAGIESRHFTANHWTICMRPPRLWGSAYCNCHRTLRGGIVCHP
jgi:hypothetical protein